MAQQDQVYMRKAGIDTVAGPVPRRSFERLWAEDGWEETEAPNEDDVFNVPAPEGSAARIEADAANESGSAGAGPETEPAGRVATTAAPRPPQTGSRAQGGATTDPPAPPAP